MSDEKVFWVGHNKVISIDPASEGGDRKVVYANYGDTVFEIDIPPKPPDGPFSGKNRPRTRNDLLERLMKYEWGAQLDILAYMKRFQTWAALYADLDRRAAESSAGVRNVTPEKPKQLRETNE